MGQATGESQQDVKLTSAEIRQDITATLGRIGGTLDALGYRMDIPARARDLYVKKPVPVIGGGGRAGRPHRRHHHVGPSAAARKDMIETRRSTR